MKPKTYNEKEKGQSLVELGASLIVLLWLLAGVVDFGRLAFQYLSIKDAAQEGASYGAIFPNNNEQIIQRVLASVADPDVIDKVIVKFTKSSGTYVCSWDKLNSDTCVTNKKTCKLNVNNVLVGDTIEITVIDEDFTFTMPLIGGQVIKLETTIKDNIIRVPLCD